MARLPRAIFLGSIRRSVMRSHVPLGETAAAE